MSIIYKQGSMKKILFLRRSSALFAVLAIIGTFVYAGCSKEKNDTNNNTGQSYVVQGNADGNQVSPAVTTGGTAVLTGTYHTGTNKLDYEITWSSLSSAASVVEFHGPAVLGVNGELLSSVTINSGDTGGSVGGSLTLTDQQEEDFMNGKYYFTITTATHIAGEVRGQIYVLIR